MSSRLLAILLLVSTAAEASGQATEDTRVLQGRVVEAGSQRALPDAWVAVVDIPSNTVTNGGGWFRLTVQGVGPYTLQVGRLGFLEMEFEISSELAAQAIILPLEPRPMTVEGLEVTVDRLAEVQRKLETRIRASPMSSRTITSDAIRRSSDVNALEVVLGRGNGILFECDRPPGELCARARPVPSLSETGPGMQVSSVLVCVDEARAWGAVSHLRALPAEEVHRVEMYGFGGREQIRVYTRWFMARQSSEPTALATLDMGC